MRIAFILATFVLTAQPARATCSCEGTTPCQEETLTVPAQAPVAGETRDTSMHTGMNMSFVSDAEPESFIPELVVAFFLVAPLIAMRHHRSRPLALLRLS